MITRHHISLACGSTIMMYLPLVMGNPLMLPVLVAGVGIGAVLPDIQMKKPGTFSLLYLVWFLVQIFKRSVLKIYIALCASILGFQPEADDKRLTHSIPGLLFLAGLIATTNLFAIAVFPSGPALFCMRLLSAGILIGLIFHFLEDLCTMKGLCIMYPFDESCRIAGSIRPCNQDDNRIRHFHILTIFTIAIIIALFGSGLCPENLMWPVSIGSLLACTGMMVHRADVRIITVS